MVALSLSHISSAELFSLHPQVKGHHHHSWGVIWQSRAWFIESQCVRVTESAQDSRDPLDVHWIH